MLNPKLIIQQPGQSERVVELSGEVSIGRAFDNSIRVDDESVSRYHLLITPRADGFLVSDLGSAAGAEVNGQSLSSDRLLSDGDEIRIGGGVVIKYKSQNSLTKQTEPAGAATVKLPAPNAAASPPKSNASSTPISHAGSQDDKLTVTQIAAAVGGVAIVFLIAAVLLWSKFSRSPKGPVSGNSSQAVIETPSPSLESNGLAARLRPGGPTLLDAQNWSANLAVLLTKKSESNFVFEREFIEAVLKHTDEFRRDYFTAARNNRLEINKAFSDKGLPELLGYVSALSQSGFQADGSTWSCQSDPTGVGLWRIPRQLALDKLGPATPVEALGTADVAAGYLKTLWDGFEREEFMYAIACYSGARGAEGELRVALEGHDRAARRNFWKMRESGLVTEQMAQRVVCFFAAGIVGEHPRAFGIDAEPLSSLY